MIEARALLEAKHRVSRGKPVVRLRCLPAVYVIGVYKAGSTDLYDKISLHPQVTPALTISSQFPNNAKTFEYYLEYYDLAAERIRNDSSLVTLDAFASLFRRRAADGKLDVDFDENTLNVSHLYIAEIRIYNPKAIFILILRNPVTWIYSAYTFWGKDTSPQDFHQRIQRGISSYQNCVRIHGSVERCVLNQKARGKLVETRIFELPYYVFVQELKKVVPPDHLMIIRAENYYAKREPTLTRVFDKLGLKAMSREWYEDVVTSNAPRNKRTYPPMLAATKQLLKEFVQPFNDQLADMLGDSGFRWLD